MEKQTAVEWLVANIDWQLLKNTSLHYEMVVKLAKKKEKEMLCDLVQSLKDYTNESHNILGHDEREPIEFVEIFLKDRENK
jgi:hypothetical protein